MDKTTRMLQFADLQATTEAARLAEEVTRALAATGRLPLTRLDVSASRGVVTLRGCVQSYYQKQIAQAAALTVPGIGRVQNDVQVQS